MYNRLICKSVVPLKPSVCYKPLRSEAGVPSCVHGGTVVMVIPFKITEWGKCIHSCIKHLQTDCRSGVHVWSALQNPLLTSSNKVSASCSVMQYHAAHFSSTSASAATFSNPWLCTGHDPVPCSVWRNTGKSHCLAPYLMFPRSACKASPAFVAEM